MDNSITAYEIEKNKEQLEYISIIDTETNILLQRLGLNPQMISPEQIHILKEDSPIFEKDSDGFSGCNFSEIIVRNGKSKLQIASTIVHEMLHTKGTNMSHSDAIQTSGGDSDPFYKGLHEAIVSSLEKDLMKNIIQKVPSLAKEMHRIGAQDDEVLDIQDETLYYPYLMHRKVLVYVCTEVSSVESEKYPTSKDVYQEFILAQFTGNLVHLNEFINKVFGESGMRILAEMGRDDESAEKTLNELKEKRDEVLKD